MERAQMGIGILASKDDEVVEPGVALAADVELCETPVDGLLLADSERLPPRMLLKRSIHAALSPAAIFATVWQFAVRRFSLGSPVMPRSALTTSRKSSRTGRCVPSKAANRTSAAMRSAVREGLPADAFQRRSRLRRIGQAVRCGQAFSSQALHSFIVAIFSTISRRRSDCEVRERSKTRSVPKDSCALARKNMSSRCAASSFALAMSAPPMPLRRERIWPWLQATTRTSSAEAAVTLRQSALKSPA